MLVHWLKACGLAILSVLSATKHSTVFKNRGAASAYFVRVLAVNTIDT